VSWLEKRRAARQARDDARVVGALWVAGALSGWPLIRATGLSSARVYLALIRLERKGWITSWWEDPRLGEPMRCRLYALQAGGSPR
jgi:hypothetical protein